MRHALAIIALLIALGAATGAACDPWKPVGGGGCSSPNYPSPGNCPGTPAPTPTPTPTPTATPTAFPHGPSELYDGQFGGVGVSGALIDANATIAMSTIENPGATVTPKPIIDCVFGCVGSIYGNWTRNNHNCNGTCPGGNAVGVEFNNNCAPSGAGRDDCYFHTVGPTPLPTVFPITFPYTAGDRMVSSFNNSSVEVNAIDPCNHNVLAWFNSYLGGLDLADAVDGSPLANGGVNAMTYAFGDSNVSTLAQALKGAAASFEINLGSASANDIAFVNCQMALEGGFVHGPPNTGAPFMVETNSLDYGQSRNPNANGGDISCDQLGNCLQQFIRTSNVALGVGEFVMQNSVSGFNLKMVPAYAPYTVNLATQIDALGRGMVILSEMEECQTAPPGPNCANSGHDVDVEIKERMMVFAVWFLGYDTAGAYKCPTLPAGQSCSLILFNDFNDHTNNASGASMYDEQFIQPVGDPNVQARPYANNDTGAADGWGSCDTKDGTSLDTGGFDDYRDLNAPCKNTSDGLNHKIGQAYFKCYHHFSYHGLAVSEICVYFNPSATDYSLPATDIPVGYGPFAHQYLPASNCTQTPFCGDAVTGGTTNSDCPAGHSLPSPCLGSLTAATVSFPVTLPKNGGVLVLTQ